MSVINKMLKDLEQRQSENALDEISSVYRAPERKFKSPLVLFLLVIVLGLLAAIGWLLLNKQDQARLESQQFSTNTKPVRLNTLTPSVKLEPTPKQNDDSYKREEQQQAARLANEKRLDEALNRQKQSASINSDNVNKPSNIPLSSGQAPIVVSPPKVKPVVIKPEASTRSINTTPLATESQSQVVPQTSKSLQPPAHQPTSKPALKIIKSSQQYTPEQRLEMLMTKAQASYEKGYISEAIEQLNKVLSISDSHIQARNLLAVAWYGRGELQQAVSILNNGLSKYPNVELWRMTAAKVYFKENNIKGAFSYLEADLPDASVEFYAMKASVARKLNLFDSAESAYAMLTKLQPKVGNWWLGLSISLDSQGKIEPAIKSYQMVLNVGGISQASMVFVQDRIQELQP